MLMKSRNTNPYDFPNKSTLLAKKSIPVKFRYAEDVYVAFFFFILIPLSNNIIQLILFLEVLQIILCCPQNYKIRN